MASPWVDRVGQRYGRLEILSYAGTSTKTSGRYRLWNCRCDCGNLHTVSFRELSRGHTQSCGCLFRETLKASWGANRTKVGQSAFNQLVYQYRRAAKSRGFQFDLGEDEFRNLTAAACYYCGLPPSQNVHTAKGTNGGLLYTGIDRIDNKRGYVPGNVRSCCKQCNFAKGSMTEDDFFAWVYRIANHRHG